MRQWLPDFQQLPAATPVFQPTPVRSERRADLGHVHQQALTPAAIEDGRRPWPLLFFVPSIRG
jgi:hypothetical protein